LSCRHPCKRRQLTLELGAGLLDDGATTQERMAGEAFGLQRIAFKLGEPGV
jgi:hypothetical protein